MKWLPVDWHMTTRDAPVPAAIDDSGRLDSVRPLWDGVILQDTDPISKQLEFASGSHISYSDSPWTNNMRFNNNIKLILRYRLVTRGCHGQMTVPWTIETGSCEIVPHLPNLWEPLPCRPMWSSAILIPALEGHHSGCVASTKLRTSLPSAARQQSVDWGFWLVCCLQCCIPLKHKLPNDLVPHICAHDGSTIIYVANFLAA